MATDARQESGLRRDNKPFATPITFEAISEPGAYVCNWSGHLLRVPKEAVAGPRSGRVLLVSSQPLQVTRIAIDPEIPLAKARGSAKEAGIPVAF